MSFRSGIINSIKQAIVQELDGTKPDIYYTTIYGNVFSKTVEFSEISDFPTITVTAGIEDISTHAGMIRQHELSVYIRIYDEDVEDIEALLEKRIIDIQTILDKYKTVSYTVTNPNGNSENHFTKMIDIKQVGTDEGLLKPKGIAELILSVTYDTYRKLL